MHNSAQGHRAVEHRLRPAAAGTAAGPPRLAWTHEPADALSPEFYICPHCSIIFSVEIHSWIRSGGVVQCSCCDGLSCLEVAVPSGASHAAS